MAMTPEVAARLRFHEDDLAIDLPPLAALAPGADGYEPAFSVEARLRGDLDSGELRGPSAALVWREALHRRVLAVADVVSGGLALLVVMSRFDQPHAAVAAIGGGGLIVLLFKMAGLYDRDDLRLAHSTLDEVPMLAQLTGLFALVLASLQAVVFGGGLVTDQIASLWIAVFTAVVAGRVLARAIAGRTSPAERCLVIGEIEQVERVRDKLRSSRARGLVVASLPLAGEEVEDGDWPAMPQIIRRVVRDLNVHRIIIAPTTTDTSGVVNLVRVAKAVGVRVSILPRMFEVVGSAVEFDDLDGMTLLGVRRFGLCRSSWLLKRAFDFSTAAVCLVLAGPLFLLIAVAIRLDSPGPTFFRQVRVGRNGKHFRIYKFRSMVADADSLKDQLRPGNEAGDGLFKIGDDPRITRIGRALRCTSLDELPQLLNVLRGEMSLVGPRPLVIDEDARVLGLDRSRLHLTPGMTGPWQIMGSRVPMEEMVGIDYLYVANWSLWLDLKVLIRTARHVARRGNV
jgi:exopolysaccharide biosynthesis polyprenyl glycosylphosphotransferase